MQAANEIEKGDELGDTDVAAAAKAAKRETVRRARTERSISPSGR